MEKNYFKNLFKKTTHYEDERFEKMYQEEINRFPPVFHIVGEKREIGFKFYIIFNAIYAMVCILCLYRDLPLMFSKLGIIIVTSIFLMIFIDRENSFGIFALIILSSILLVAKAPMFLFIFFAIGVLWTTIATCSQFIAFKRAQRRSADLYKLELEHELRKYRNHTNASMNRTPEYELPEIRYCPVCGFSIPEGEEECTNCNAKAEEEPKRPSLGSMSAPVVWPVSNSGPGLKQDDADVTSSSADDVLI